MTKKYFPFFRAADIITVVFVSVLSLVEMIFFMRIEHGLVFLSSNAFLLLFIFFSAKTVFQKEENKYSILKFARDWYLFPSILFIYTQGSSITHQIHGEDFDNILIAVDFWMFGANPTQWISQYAHPLITEILQIAYSSYYLFFVALFFELYRRSDLKDFHNGSMIVVYGFYLSYIGYLLFPAIGPRFTLHDFFATDTELPGIFLTKYLRIIVNSGGGITSGALDPAASVHRDAFPSGHTQLTLVAMYVAFTCKTKIRWWLMVFGSLLIISTVYMRYHYVTDVLTGILFFFATIWSGKRLNVWWNQKTRQ